MSDQGRLQSKLDQSQLRRYREVFPAVHVAPLGKRRSKVKIGGCLVDVEAQRSDEFKKGQRVTVVQSSGGGGATILDGPPGVEGPSIQGQAARVTGISFEPPPPAGIPPVGPLVISWDFGTPLTLTATRFTELPAPVVNPPISSQTVELLTTSGFVMVQGMKQASMLIMSGNNFALDTIQEIAYADLNNELGRYQLVTNGTDIGGDARHSIFPPTELNSEIYWVELDDLGSDFRFRLCRVQPGSINTSKIVDHTITRNKTEVSDEFTVQDLHFPIMNPSFTNTFSILFIVNGRWHMFGALRWYNGTSYVTDPFQAIFESPGAPGIDDFSVGPLPPLQHPNGVLLPGIIDGNRSAMEESFFPQIGSYNMRLNEALNLDDATWAAFNSPQNCSIESLNGLFMVTQLSGSQVILRGDPEGSDFSELVRLDMGAVPGFKAHGLWLSES